MEIWGNNHFRSQIQPLFQKPGTRFPKSGKRFPAMCNVFCSCVTFPGQWYRFPAWGTVSRLGAPFSGQGVPLLYVIGFVSNRVPISSNRRVRNTETYIRMRICKVPARDMSNSLRISSFPGRPIFVFTEKFPRDN